MLILMRTHNIIASMVIKKCTFGLLLAVNTSVYSAFGISPFSLSRDEDKVGVNLCIYIVFIVFIY